MSNLDNYKTRKLASRVSLMMLVGALAFIWLRTGLVPAASGGDEIWWSESGYWLLKEGNLRWAVMDDIHGSGIRSFWPPVLPIIQSAVFAVGGLTSFSICAQSSLHCTLLIILVWLLGRQSGVSRTTCSLASLAMFGLLSVERSMVQVRMENMTAIGALAFIWALNAGTQTKTINCRFIWYIAAGFFLSIGLLSYYPLSPFLLVGATLVVLSNKTWLSLFGVISGGLPFSLLAMYWILNDWPHFSSQILKAGSDHYFTWASLLTPFVNMISWHAPERMLSTWEAVVILIVSLLVISKSRSVERQCLAIMGLFLTLPIFFFIKPALIGGGVFTVMLLYTYEVTFESPLLDYPIKGTQLFLPLFGFLILSITWFTALYQSKGRDYESVNSGLSSLDFSTGGVAISQRAWLALRERIPADRLHFLVYSGASLSNVSKKITAPDAGNYFNHLVIEADKLEDLKNLYPWIKEGINAGTYRQLLEIKPEFKALPWAQKECYHLVVFSRIQKTITGINRYKIQKHPKKSPCPQQSTSTQNVKAHFQALN